MAINNSKNYNNRRTSNNKSNNRINSKSNNKISSKVSNSNDSNILFYIIVAVILLFLYSNYVVNKNEMNDEIQSEIIEEEIRDNFSNVAENSLEEKTLYLMKSRTCFINDRKSEFNKQNDNLDALKPKIAKLKEDLLSIN